MKVQLDRAKFLSKFKSEASEHLQNLNNGLLVLEKDPENEEVIREIFRVVHTLKGASKMMGFTKIGEIAHKIEDIFEEIKEKRVRLTDELFNILFTGFDAIELLMQTEVEGEESGIDTDNLCHKLEQAAKNLSINGKQKQDERRKKQVAGGVTSFEKTQPKASKKLNKPDETVRVSTASLDKLVNLGGELVINQIEAKSLIAELKNLLTLANEQDQAIMTLRGRLAVEEDYRHFGPGELKGTLNRVESLNKKHKETITTLIKAQGDCMSRQEKIVNELGEELIGTRMLPISVVFDVFPRAVHDLSKRLKKDIKLEIVGEQTRLDKKMLEEIRDPLLHLVRNAVDHGIESPSVREKMRKPRQGTIILVAQQEGDQAVIKITDDGSGMNPKNLRQAAVKKGFLTAEEAEALSEQEALYLPFNPGFSTSSVITDISGRGVGLDVVKNNVESLKGIVNVTSRLGKGTEVSLKIPLTMAISRALLVKSSDETFAFPISSVIEALRISASEIKSIAGKEALCLRDQLLPLARLSKVLSLEEQEPTLDSDTGVVIVNCRGERMGFLIDEVLGEQEIVVKTLGSHLKKVKNVAGATIVKGEAVVILHLPDLVDSAKEIASGKVSTAIVRDEEYEAASILVVDDSLTTRELEKSILEASGYKVEEAIDGIEALEKVAQKKFDLLVVDVEMPRMDGFQLTERLKKEKKYGDIPVVIVTSRATDEDKKRGIEVGADAYIVKSDFDQQNLLDNIELLVGRRNTLSDNKEITD